MQGINTSLIEQGSQKNKKIGLSQVAVLIIVSILLICLGCLGVFFWKKWKGEKSSGTTDPNQNNSSGPTDPNQNNSFGATDPNQNNSSGPTDPNQNNSSGKGWEQKKSSRPTDPNQNNSSGPTDPNQNNSSGPTDPNQNNSSGNGRQKFVLEPIRGTPWGEIHDVITKKLKETDSSKRENDPQIRTYEEVKKTYLTSALDATSKEERIPQEKMVAFLEQATVFVNSIFAFKRSAPEYFEKEFNENFSYFFQIVAIYFDCYNNPKSMRYLDIKSPTVLTSQLNSVDFPLKIIEAFFLYVPSSHHLGGGTSSNRLKDLIRDTLTLTSINEIEQLERKYFFQDRK